MPRLDLNAICWENWSVIDRQGRATVPLKLNPPQQIIRDRLMARSDQGRPMWAIILKGRRCGSSTYSEAIITAHCIAFANARAMTIAHKGKNAKELFDTAGTFHNQFFRSISVGAERHAHELFFPHQGGISKHTLATAGTAEGGRGLMLSALLLSECAFYENAETVLTGYESTVNPDQGTIRIYESTANGRVGAGQAFYEKWQDAVEGKIDFEPIFISWLDDPGDRRPAEYGQPPYDKDERELIQHYNADPEQIAFRRFAIPNLCQGSAELFLQEYPHTAEVAFITSGDPAFLPSEMQRVESSVKKHPIKFRGNVEENREGQIVLRQTPLGYLKIWDRPRPDHKYYIGADAARGLVSADGNQHGDFAAAVGINGSTGQQVFTFEAKIPISDFAWNLYLLGHWYNKAMLNIEHTGGDGFYATKELRDKYHYPNFMPWRSKDDSRARKLTENPHIGWETTYRTRQQMLVTLREVIRTGDLELYCKTLMMQMYNAEREWDFRWEINRGHDDVFVACCLAVIAWQQNPPPKVGLRNTRNLDKGEEDAAFPNFEPEYGVLLRRKAQEIIEGGRPPLKEGTLEGI